jgi:ADP-heptose:LPS heptosyltransferase
MSESPSAQKILIIKLGALGDIIRSLDAIHSVRKSFPHSQIDLLTRKQHVAFCETIPWFDKVRPAANPRLWELGKWLDFTRMLRSFWNKRYMALRDVGQLSPYFANQYQELAKLPKGEYPSADFLYNFLSVSLKTGQKEVLEKALLQYAGPPPADFHEKDHPAYNKLDRCIWWARLILAKGDVQ